MVLIGIVLRLIERRNQATFCFSKELKTLTIVNQFLKIPTDYKCNDKAGHDELVVEEVDSAKYILNVKALVSVGYDFTPIVFNTAQIDLFIEEQLLHGY